MMERQASATPGTEAQRSAQSATALSGDLQRDWQIIGDVLQSVGERIQRLPPKPQRSEAEQARAASLLTQARQLREAFMGRHAAAVYDRLTDGRANFLRMEDLAREASIRFPGLVPTTEAIERERQLPQMHHDGVQIDQGIFFAHVLADRDCGLHLLHAMRRPTPRALDERERFERTGRLELPSMTLERDGRLGRITFHHQAWLNAEDDEYQQALELLLDLVLLDDRIQIGVLRGAPMTKPKYAGRRVFGAGINLTQLYHGKISLVRFMLQRETGPLGKIYRGLSGPELGPPDLEDGLEKPFIGAVDAFAIGGHCQMLLILDRVIAERGSYFNLPARKEGIIPGVSNLRLPRFVGERATRQGIFFNRDFQAESPAGLMICDEVVEGEAAMEAAIVSSAADLTSAGVTSLVGNRRALRIGAEPIDAFRRYMATYAREQAYCMYSPALIDNLVRNWNAHQRQQPGTTPREAASP